MNVLILGPAGSGKTTQARLLADYLNIPYLTSSDVLHFASLGDDPQSSHIKQAMDSGELVDDEVVLRLMEEHMKQPEHENGTLIDGFPRNVKEAEGFSVPIDKVIYLKIPDNIVINRLMSRGRVDDTPELIAKRLEIYHKETEPLLEFYKNKEILQEIDATQSIDEIAEEIKDKFK